jgi:hypothetical protein
VEHREESSLTHSPEARFSGGVDSGTVPAIKNISKSGGQSSRSPGGGQRGGARNSRSRTSDFVDLRQAKGVLSATSAAISLGLFFNRHVTIHWARAGVSEERASEATTKYLTLARDWLRKQGEQFAYVYVREGRSGTHVHILMHVPPNLAPGFGWRQRGWIKKIAGCRYRRRIVKTRPIGKNTRAAWAARSLYGANLSKIVAYLLKGVSKEVAEAIGLNWTSPQGRVVGKRVGWSENLGSKAISTRDAEVSATTRSGQPNVVALLDGEVVDNLRTTPATTSAAISGTRWAGGVNDNPASPRETYFVKCKKRAHWLSPLPILQPHEYAIGPRRHAAAARFARSDDQHRFGPMPFRRDIFGAPL